MELSVLLVLGTIVPGSIGVMVALVLFHYAISMMLPGILASVQIFPLQARPVYKVLYLYPDANSIDRILTIFDLKLGPFSIYG